MQTQFRCAFKKGAALTNILVPIRSRSLAAWGQRAILLIGLAMILEAGTLQAADRVAVGRSKAQSCQGCHGLDGIGKVPGAPNLAGQDEAYFIKAMGDYKSGARKNEMMSVAIEQVSPADFADLAAFYASLGPK